MPLLHLTWGNDSHDTKDMTGVHSRELSVGYYRCLGSNRYLRDSLALTICDVGRLPK